MAQNDTNAIRRGDVEVALDELGDKFVGTPFEREDGSVVLLHGAGLKELVLPTLNPALPGFVTAAETVIEPTSFKDYIIAFKSAPAICRASLGSNKIVALLDYHGAARMGDGLAASPNRLAHTVTLLCPWDLDYAKWRAIFGQPMDRDAFAAVLEDLVHTISEPAVADLSEAIDNLRIDRQVRFKSKVDRTTGTVKFHYEEIDAEADAETGEVALPREVKIVVSMFQGGELIELVTKLRYAFDKGKVAFSLVVPGIEKLERDQFRRIGEDVRSATNTPVFYTT